MQPTVQTISDTLLQQISERIEDRTGLHFPPARFGDLERGLAQAAQEAGYRDAGAYTESLLSRNLRAADLEALAGSLTIGETHFFRDPGFFGFLETTLLPELIAAKRDEDRQLRIWSAGCASGEEPYSIAILLHRLIPDLSDWHITILGSDINPKVLAKAAAGIYTEWSFRDTPAWVKPRYFVARPGHHYEIQSWLKSMLAFACLNLVDDNYPSVLSNTNAMDIIICRNVLLYFTQARIPQVIQRFHRALVAGGRLVLGAVEVGQLTLPEFLPIPAPGVALYRKSAAAASQTEARFEGRTAVNRSELARAIRPTPVFPHKASPSPSTAPVPSVPLRRGDYAEAESLYAAGRYSDARTLLLAGGDGPRDKDPRVALLLAQCHANLGELAEALLWCERALATAKTDPALHFLRAGILQEVHRDDEAMMALRSVLFLDPGHVAAHLSMANLYRRQDRRPEAAKHFANVRRLLANRDDNEEVPQSGGLTVGRVNAILAATAGLVEEKEGIRHE